ncbi:MAG: OmpH family outer membrane protein [Saprospiraceae bacterium]
MITKNNFLIKLFLGCCLCLCFGISSCNSAPTVAYIKTAIVFEQFNGKKELERRLLYEEQKRKASVDSLTLELQVLEKQIRAGGQTMQLVKVFEQKRSRLQQEEQAFQKKHQLASEQYTTEIWKQINQYVQVFGEQNGYDLIHGANGSGNLMYGNEAYDITDQVIHFINQKYEGN